MVSLAAIASAALLSFQWNGKDNIPNGLLLRSLWQPVVRAQVLRFLQHANGLYSTRNSSIEDMAPATINSS